MHQHAARNRAYRLAWNEATGQWRPVPEFARTRGGRRGAVAAGLLLAGLSAGAAGAAGPSPPAPTQLPTGATVTAGQVSLHGSGATLDVRQGSRVGAIDWTSFDLGSAASVHFLQPDAASVTLNRVTGGDASRIFGHVDATGQVFLVNPNGVYFAPGATVDVGGLVASTLGLGDEDLAAGRLRFARDPSRAAGSVVNEGTLTARPGGYVALLAPEVRNPGVVTARLGGVALAAGDAVTLRMDGHALVGVSVEPAALQALVDNGGAVITPGGRVLLSARAASQLAGGVVRNTGVVEATGLASRGGRILLEASDAVDEDGTLSAVGTGGGAGGT
ncbi:MAG TPA: filamentous hemagglutinin N-terminal domain-containing protein, partial [Burkholderiaceae bacterium]